MPMRLSLSPPTVDLHPLRPLGLMPHRVALACAALLTSGGLLAQEAAPAAPPSTPSSPPAAERHTRRKFGR